MDSAVTMAKFEFLNSFLADRLLAAAGEIFQVVKDTLTEYQQEIDQIKQENNYLKNLLTEKCDHRERDDEIIEEVPQECPVFTQAPLDSKPSIIQVKVEFSTMRQDAEAEEPMNDPPSCASPASAKGLPSHFSTTRTINREQKEGALHNDSDVTVKREECNSLPVCTDGSESITENRDFALTDTQATHPSSHMSSDQLSPAGAYFLCQTEKVVYCEYCGKPFRSRYHLRRHMAVHQKEKPRPYRCDLCGKSYSYAQVLEVHRRTHTGERPYRCRYCGRLFNQRGHLSDHERIHTGEKPFSCTICGKRFIQSGQVRKHMRNNHQVE